MPSTIDPQITAATVALKRSQTKLTELRRKVLSRDYIPRAAHAGCLPPRDPEGPYDSGYQWKLDSARRPQRAALTTFLGLSGVGMPWAAA